MRNRATGALAAILALACLAAAPAEAARIHPPLLSETLPSEETPFAVAVDQSTHHFYVASFGTSTRRVFGFEEGGQIDAAHPELIGAPTLRPFAVAVDNSGGLYHGYVYATDVSGTVQQFDPSGEASAVTITEAAIPPNGTAQGGSLAPVVNTGSFNPRAVAVGGSGNVFVTESSAKAVDVFKPNGEFAEQLAAGVIGTSPTGIALDAAGDIYLSRNESGALGNGLFELNPTGECVTVGCAPIDPAPILGVALDEAREAIYTTASSGSEEGRFTEYNALTHEAMGTTRPTQLHSPYGIAVDEASGKLIVADTLPTREGTIQVFGAVETVPDVRVLPLEAITDHSATLKGEIGAAGVPGATCVFQYADQEAFEEHGFEGAEEAPCEPEGPFSGTAWNAVEAKIEGLRGGTTYHERLLGTNENGSNATDAEELITLGPTVSGIEAAGIGQTTATMKGAVDPNGSPTSYRFEYLTQAQYEAEGESWGGATAVPAGGEAIGGGEGSVPVSKTIEGLAPGTAFRFRIVAASGEGETQGDGIHFSTFGAAPAFGPCPNEVFREGGPSRALPECRAYEQASPVVKNGANVQGAIDSVQAALEGGAITFFTNTGIPGGEGAQEFPTYLARRAADGSGWSTQGLLPPASYGPLAHVLGWTETLEDTYDSAIQGPGEGAVLRRSSADGSVVRVGSPANITSPLGLAYAGSSQGGRVALLESSVGRVVPGDLPGKQNVYAYDRDTGVLAVAGVMNDGSVPAGGAMAGPYNFEGGGTGLSTAGGALGSYFTQAGHAISEDGGEVFFTAGEAGQLYVRLNPLAAQSAMSGGNCTEAAKACTVRISAPLGVADPETPAAFAGASADGRYAYFLDSGKLTPDATGGSGYDLYRYDIANGSLADLTLDAEDAKGARVEGLAGIGGPRGEDAYFVAAGKLSGEASQAPVGETNLYALHGTTIGFVTRLGTSGGPEGEQRNWAPNSALSGFFAVHASRVSADGQTLLFTSTRQLTPYRNRGTAELYLYRAGAGIGCVSCDPSGEAPGGPASVQRIPPVGITRARTYAFMTRNLSSNGRRVIFDTEDRLVASDENSVNDVYEWEAKGEGSCGGEVQDGGCLYLLSSGAKGAGPSWFADADETGENVFLFTAQPLVAQDKDGLVDVYDARMGGGIAAQGAVPPVPCQEEGCLEGAALAPHRSSPRSAQATGANAVAPPPCKRGFHRRHGKCLRRHRAKHHKRHRHIKHHRHRHGKKSQKAGHRHARAKGGRS